MDKTRFKEGDKVYWNAGWNEHAHYENPEDYWKPEVKGKPYGWMLRGPYDFGYYSAKDDMVILYNEGERSMQDAICVSECYVITEKEYNQIKQK